MRGTFKLLTILIHVINSEKVTCKKKIFHYESSLEHAIIKSYWSSHANCKTLQECFKKCMGHLCNMVAYKEDESLCRLYSDMRNKSSSYEYGWRYYGIDCHTYSVPHASVVNVHPAGLSGSCNSGYIYSYPKTIGQCVLNGLWTKVFQCRKFYLYMSTYFVSLHPVKNGQIFQVEFKVQDAVGSVYVYKNAFTSYIAGVRFYGLGQFVAFAELNPDVDTPDVIEDVGGIQSYERLSLTLQVSGTSTNVSLNGILLASWNQTFQSLRIQDVSALYSMVLA